jgi:DNA polymerase-3 subunit delta'
MNISWLHELEEGWAKRVEHGRVPHAIMLFGTAGVGKRALAAWIARERLGLPGSEEGSQYPLEVPVHADLHWIAPIEDKKSIGIDQIRSVEADLGLTSYSGDGKIVIIEPANAMTPDAANSLLKTLEEPPGDALLILVADRIGRLPATILSRCQRINVAVPKQDLGVAWLDRMQPESTWSAALQLVGGAPLAAIGSDERLDQASGMMSDFEALPKRQASPMDVAARWVDYGAEFWLEWLYRTVTKYIKWAVCGASGTSESRVAESVLNRIDRRNLFCYLDTINRLRGQAAGSYNEQLTLESLLIDWAGGLKDCHRSYHPGEALPVANLR